MSFQQTLQKTVRCSGVTLHSGVQTLLSLCPAPENTGIIFRRTDMPNSPSIIANARFVTNVERATTLVAPPTDPNQMPAMVTTVEHVLAALHASQIDNCIVEMDNIEPPIMDGSALPYMEMIQKAGIQTQTAPAKYFEVKAPIYFEVKDTIMAIFPADELKISCTISFGASMMDTQYLSTVVTPESFLKELSPARTFCQFQELEYLYAAGLAQGGSIDNALIINGSSIISRDGLRFPNELVRHKMLDIVGDLFLVGARVKGHVVVVKPGHPTNVKLAQMMLQSLS